MGLAHGERHFAADLSDAVVKLLAMNTATVPDRVIRDSMLRARAACLRAIRNRTD